MSSSARWAAASTPARLTTAISTVPSPRLASAWADRAGEVGQFNEQTFPQALALSHIGYEHIAELGGHRGKINLSKPSPNAYWRVRGFCNYADYALTEPFAVGFAYLRERSSRQQCAIMCAEAVWWRCHRRIIADYLLAAGECVRHIIGPHHIDEANLTPGAVVRGDGTIVYPAEDSQMK